jgi:hypothetical protein
MANITGWGRSTWSSGTWDEPVPVIVTGVAGTTGLGDESISVDISFAVTGVAGTTGLGNETVNLDFVVSVTGIAGTATLGDETIVQGTGQDVTETGLSATGSVGSVNIWSTLSPSQTASWTELTPSQTASWEEIAA